MSGIITKILFFAGLILSLSTLSIAQNEPTVTPEERQKAAEYMQAKEWKKAAEAYQSISNREPQNSGALMRLGIAFYSMKEYKKAAEAYERSAKINVNPVVTYNLACVYSLMNDKAKAFEWLDRALTAGFGNLKQVQTDADLGNIRGSAEFKAFEEKMDKAIRPCDFDEKSRQFDFWVGDWDVKTQQGATAGTNLVQKAENGCVLIENWSGSFGGTGKSLNFYDKQIGKWRQVWIDNAGNATLFTGGFHDGAMRYEAEQTGTDGKKIMLKLTFTPLETGKVRQHGEQSTDGGKTWVTTYDFVYTLKSFGAK